MTFWQQVYLESKWFEHYMPIACAYSHKDGLTVGVVAVDFEWGVIWKVY